MDEIAIYARILQKIAFRSARRSNLILTPSAGSIEVVSAATSGAGGFDDPLVFQVPIPTGNGGTATATTPGTSKWKDGRLRKTIQ
jgi:hypothetical protein